VSPLGAVFLVLLVVLAWGVLSPRGADLDTRVFRAINRRHLPGPLETVIRLVSHLGQVAAQVAIWGAVWLWADRQAGLTGGYGVLVCWVTCRVLKSATARARPYLAIEGARLVGHAPTLSSFPSSHAAHAVYTAVMLPQLLGWGTGPALASYTVAGLVCYSRIYLGAHYPRDVLAGVVIGLGGALWTRWAGVSRG
jgi:membrane-associated phospholipid phosphatase